MVYNVIGIQYGVLYQKSGTIFETKEVQIFIS
jgi:hypothetical protein